MSILLTIADAVVTLLNGTTFSEPFVAARSWRPSFSLEDLSSLRVSVRPSSETITPADRGTDFFDCVIDVGVQKKILNDDEVDRLDALTEELVDHLRNNAPAGLTQVAFVSIAREPVVSPEHLSEHRAFTSIITVTYRARR